MRPENLDSLIRSGSRKSVWSPSASAQTVCWERSEIEHLIEHRPPFLFVDRITAIDPDRGAIVGGRTIQEDDPVFAGHFPGYPIYPGVLLLETIGQLGLCLLQHLGSAARSGAVAPRPVRAVHIHHAVFLDGVRPGDALEIAARLIEMDDYTAVCEGQILVAGTIRTYGIVEVFLVES